MSLPKILMSGRADQIIYLSEEFDPEHTYIHTGHTGTVSAHSHGLGRGPHTLRRGASTGRYRVGVPSGETNAPRTGV